MGAETKAFGSDLDGEETVSNDLAQSPGKEHGVETEGQ